MPRDITHTPTVLTGPSDSVKHRAETAAEPVDVGGTTAALRRYEVMTALTWQHTPQQWVHVSSFAPVTEAQTLSFARSLRDEPVQLPRGDAAERGLGTSTPTVESTSLWAVGIGLPPPVTRRDSERRGGRYARSALTMRASSEQMTQERPLRQHNAQKHPGNRGRKAREVLTGLLTN